MALAVTIKKATKLVNGVRFAIGTIAFDSSYPTGGEALAKEALGFSGEIAGAVFAPTAGYLFSYDLSNEKVIAYTPVKTVAAHTHTFTGTAMSITPTTLGGEPTTKLLQNDAGTLKSTDITAIPLGTPAGTLSSAGAIAAAAAAEVANTIDLSALTVVPFFAWGW